MYVACLKEDEITWRKGWYSNRNINGITNIEYKGVNSLLLSFISSKEKYEDPRWYTFVQINNKGWKLNKSAKGKGVPIEFWSSYNIRNKRKYNLSEYNEYIEKHPEEVNDFKIIARCTYVYNAKYIDGVDNYIEVINNSKIEPSKIIKNIIKNINVKYREEGDGAYYNTLNDEIVIPKSSKFFDKYYYYATQLHEICHATGNEKRLNRNFGNSKEAYAKEELIAEISSSFLMQKLNIQTKNEHYDNHKSYIQSWIKILENKPQELFKAISKANEICEYIDRNVKNRNYRREDR